MNNQNDYESDLYIQLQQKEENRDRSKISETSKVPEAHCEEISVDGKWYN